MTPELEYLQVKWAAHLPFATATALLTELLPIENAITAGSVKRRVRVVGAALENSATTPSVRTEAVRLAERHRKLSAVAVDSAWLRHCDPPRELGQGRHVNVVAGRACFEDDQSRVCAYPQPGEFGS